MDEKPFPRASSYTPSTTSASSIDGILAYIPIALVRVVYFGMLCALGVMLGIFVARGHALICLCALMIAALSVTSRNHPWLKAQNSEDYKIRKYALLALNVSECIDTLLERASPGAKHTMDKGALVGDLLCALNRGEERKSADLFIMHDGKRSAAYARSDAERIWSGIDWRTDGVALQKLFRRINDQEVHIVDKDLNKTTFHINVYSARYAIDAFAALLACETPARRIVDSIVSNNKPLEAGES